MDDWSWRNGFWYYIFLSEETYKASTTSSKRYKNRQIATTVATALTTAATRLTMNYYFTYWEGHMHLFRWLCHPTTITGCRWCWKLWKNHICFVESQQFMIVCQRSWAVRLYCSSVHSCHLASRLPWLCFQYDAGIFFSLYIVLIYAHQFNMNENGRYSMHIHKWYIIIIFMRTWTFPEWQSSACIRKQYGGWNGT